MGKKERRKHFEGSRRVANFDTLFIFYVSFFFKETSDQRVQIFLSEMEEKGGERQVGILRTRYWSHSEMFRVIIPVACCQSFSGSSCSVRPSYFEEMKFRH